MPALSFQLNRPTETYTIDQFIACQSSTDISYHNLSFIDNVVYAFMNEKILYPTYNILSDYLDEIRDDYCVIVTLTDKDLMHYAYRPKLLCYEIYGKTELAFMILLINDMASFKQFNKKRLLMPTKVRMSELCKYLYNSNYQVISKYNQKNN